MKSKDTQNTAAVKVPDVMSLDGITQQRSALPDYLTNGYFGNVRQPYAQKILHFYCYKCKYYELKISPHYRAQKQRFARRRRKEAAKSRKPEQPQVSGK